MWQAKWSQRHGLPKRLCTNGRSTTPSARPGLRLGVSERSLSVLDALLDLPSRDRADRRGRPHRLPIQPSAHSLRAHGMPASTLRRHLAVLVDAWPAWFDATAQTASATRGRAMLARSSWPSVLICRRSSCAQKSSRVWRPMWKPKARALKLVRERITLCRRDIAKMIATGIAEASRPAGEGGAGRLAGQSTPPSARSWVRFRARPRASSSSRSPTSYAQLADDVLNLLETHVKSRIRAPIDSQSERHIQNSNPDALY